MAPCTVTPNDRGRYAQVDRDVSALWDRDGSANVDFPFS